MSVLMDRMAAVYAIASDTLRDAHEVRELRNALAHDPQSANDMSLGECKSRLSRYLNYLPRQW